ncbi:MAG: AraC family transcriptional regulator [Leptonema illini]|uniref:AraC family transcriptional regulator n=1 Tax=Leptonema illini TaxID=183 RepID=A0A833H4P3_9LEPT|nr:MAG: AraC family transcriptional regulator [Leptonema illini]
MILLITSSLALILGLSELLVRERSAKTYIYSGIQISFAVILLQGHFLFYGGLEERLWLFRLEMPFTWSLGPLVLVYCKMALENRRRPARSDMMYAVPVLLAVVALIPLYLQPPEEKIAVIQAVRALRLEGADVGVLIFLLGASYSAACALFAVGLVLKSSARERWLTDSALRLILLIGCSTVFLGALTVLSVLLRSIQLTEIVLFIVAFFVILMHALSRRNPHFFFDLVLAARAEKYRYSVLKNLDLDHIEASLRRLMEDEHLYKEEDLDMPAVASRLGLRPQQLSEFFNGYLGISFHAFLNRYRIADAKRMLLDHPDQTVLSIAYESGFNSKSSFNSAFLKETGKTPTQFRQARP